MKRGIFKHEDVLCIINAHDYVRQYLNQTYRFIETNVNSYLLVPLDKRDQMYYKFSSVLKNRINEFQHVLNAFYECRMINTSKRDSVFDELHQMISALNNNVEVHISDSI